MLSLAELRTKFGDWQDSEGIIIEQSGKLDQTYLEDWLTQFAEVLEQPEILRHYHQIWQHITNSR